MRDIVSQVADGVFVIAVWNKKLDFYVNSYLIIEKDRNIFIDAGDAQYLKEFKKHVGDLGIVISPNDCLILTHGHYDHLGAVSFFNPEMVYLHELDMKLIADDSFKRVHSNKVAMERLSGLSIYHVGHHTPGSVLVHDEKRNIAFCGDLVCFFGYPTPSDGLVSMATDVVEQEYVFYNKVAQDPDFRKSIKFEPFQEFVDAMKTLSSLDANTLCTGHGIVLKENAQAYCRALYGLSAH